MCALGAELHGCAYLFKFKFVEIVDCMSHNHDEDDDDDDGGGNDDDRTNACWVLTAQQFIQTHNTNTDDNK